MSASLGSTQRAYLEARAVQLAVDVGVFQKFSRLNLCHHSISCGEVVVNSIHLPRSRRPCGMTDGEAYLVRVAFHEHFNERSFTSARRTSDDDGPWPHGRGRLRCLVTHRRISFFVEEAYVHTAFGSCRAANLATGLYTAVLCPQNPPKAAVVWTRDRGPLCVRACVHAPFDLPRIAYRQRRYRPPQRGVRAQHGARIRRTKDKAHLLSKLLQAFAEQQCCSAQAFFTDLGL